MSKLRGRGFRFGRWRFVFFDLEIHDVFGEFLCREYAGG